MRDNVYAEYKGTIHDANRAGVRAICSDCHVPKEPGRAHQAQDGAPPSSSGATSRGVIDTKEKFEKRNARSSPTTCGSG